jgi:hypothetical protein
LIAVGFFLAKHPLLFKALFVHLVGDSEIVVVILVKRIVIIPRIPQPWIVVSPPREREIAAASETETIISEKPGTSISAKAVLPEAMLRKSGSAAKRCAPAEP